MKILLGVTGDPVGKSAQITADCNKIGGLPVWLSGEVCRPRCDLCGRNLVLLVQMYCPLSQSAYHRSLYVFSCPNKTCQLRNQSWKVLRSQARFQAPKVGTDSSTQIAMVTESWGEHDDDWGDDNDDSPGIITQIEPYSAGDGAGAPHNYEQIDQDNDRMVRNNNFGDRDNDHVDQDNDCMNRDNDCVDQDNDCVDQDIDCVDQDNDCVNPHNDHVDWDNDCVDWDNDHVDQNNDNVDQDTCDEFIAEDLPEHLLQESVLSQLIKPGNTELEDISAAMGLTALTGSVNANILPSYYIDVFEEPPATPVQLDHEMDLLQKYQQATGINVQANCGRNCGGEQYEKMSIKHDDVVFHKFQKVISCCPEQIVRYSHQGEPLYICSQEEEASMCCCGAPRVYEFQLMPVLVNLLRFSSESDVAVEFGTVLVYTCRDSCWSDDNLYKMEVAIVQADPDHSFFSP